jgi:hypothetical protein
MLQTMRDRPRSPRSMLRMNYARHLAERRGCVERRVAHRSVAGMVGAPRGTRTIATGASCADADPALDLDQPAMRSQGLGHTDRSVCITALHSSWQGRARSHEQKMQPLELGSFVTTDMSWSSTLSGVGIRAPETGHLFTHE